METYIVGFFCGESEDTARKILEEVSATGIDTSHFADTDFVLADLPDGADRLLYGHSRIAYVTRYGKIEVKDAVRAEVS